MSLSVARVVASRRRETSPHRLPSWIQYRNEEKPAETIENGKNGEGSNEPDEKVSMSPVQVVNGNGVKHQMNGKDQMSQQDDPTKNEYLYKILVIGDLGTGKTSFIKRYVHHFFSQSYRATIGVDFALKVLQWNDNTIVRLQLWDIAGQERFGNMTRVYYKEAVGAIIVYDVTRHQTFDAVIKWKQDLDSKVQLADGSPVPCVLVGNKCDQPKCKELEDNSRIEEFSKEYGFCNWFDTSAKDNVNIDEAASALVAQILARDKMTKPDQIDPERIALSNGEKVQTDKSCLC